MTGAGFVLALLGSLWDPGFRVSISAIWLAVLAVIVFDVLVIAFNLAGIARRAANIQPPRAIYASVSAQRSDGAVGPITLLFGASALFRINIMVTIGYIAKLTPGTDAFFERSIGIGKVINVQADGSIQVLVSGELPDSAALWGQIRSQEPNTIGQTIIRPWIEFSDSDVEDRYYE